MISFSTLFAMQRYIDTNGDVNLNENLVAHYLLNNNAVDSHGTYDGTPSGGVDFQGDVASFDGVDDKITTTLNPQGTAITISFWIINSDTTKTAMHIFNKEDSGDGIENCSIDTWSASGLRYINEYASGLYNATSAYTLIQDQLYHVCYVMTSTDAKTYIDGTLESTDLGTDFLTGAYLNAETFMFGEPRFGESTRWFNGDLSNFRVYSDAKNQTFIDELYAEGYYPKPLTEPTTVGLIAHYPLTGTAEDSTGSYDGVETSVSYIDDDEFGAVADFNGTSSEISVATAIIPSTNTDMAISFWAYTTTLATDQRVLYLNEGADLNFQAFSFDASSAAFRTNGNITAELISSTVAINTWYHCVYNISDSGGVELYLNNVADGTSAISNGVTHDLKLWIGADRLNDFNLDGNLRNIRFYNNTLTAQEITDIYNYEKNFRSIDIDDGLVAYYSLANNSLDNYYNEYDGIDTDMTYDGDGAVFNGTTSYVEFGTHHSSEVSAFLTFELNETGQQNKILMNGGYHSGWEIEWQLITDANDYVVIAIYSTAGVANYGLWETDILYTIGDKKHIGFTFDDSGINGLKAYVDGVEATITNTSEVGTFNGIMNNGNPITIGAMLNGSTAQNFVDCKAKNVRIYNKALTLEQIKVIYDSEKVIVIEEPVFDQALLYDVNNIATEFIA